MRFASRRGAAAVAAAIVLALSAAPAANAEDEGPPPRIEFSIYPNSITTDPDTIIAFSIPETQSPPLSASCVLDGAPAFDCTSGVLEYVGLAEGGHTLLITPSDTRGPGDTETVVWTIDLTPPETTVTGPAWTNTAGTGIEYGSPSSDLYRYECSVNDGAFAACPTTYPAGQVALKVRAVDYAGLADLTPAEITFGVDTTPPQTTATITQTGPNELTMQFGATDSESGVTSVVCTVENVVWTGTMDETSSTVIDNGTLLCVSAPFVLDTTGRDVEVTLWAQAVDAAGNVDPTPATATWVIDRTPPVVSIDSGPTALTTSPDASFVISATDAHHGLQGSGIDRYICFLSGSGPATCSANTNYGELPDGDYELTVTVVDEQGLTSEPKYWNWTVDTTPPVTSFTTVPPAYDSHASGEIEWAVTGGPATSVCSLDDAPAASCSSPFGYADLADGQHKLVVQSTDSAGNAETVGATHIWYVETTDPTVSILGAPDFITNDPVAKFAFSVSGAAGLECTLDGDPVDCSSSPEYTVADGDHTFSVVAFDYVGDRSAAATHAWTVDTVVPSVLIGTAPSSPSADAVATFGFITTGATEVECTLDDVVTPCAVTQSFPVADGSHTLSVVAVDDAGNRSDAAVHSWTVDTIAPRTAFLVTPPEVSGASVIFEFAEAVPDTARTAFAIAAVDLVFECSLDDAAFELCESPVTVPGLGDGLHTFAVRATDAAGNVEASPAEYSWRVSVPVVAVAPAKVLGATGSSVSPVVAASALLALVGGVLLMTRRRRSQ